MIDVKNLTKRYAGQNIAIADLTFSVERGEIVGFLGPNGAGKSTTMRILSGYLPATSGTVRIDGYDVFYQSEKVRRTVGYMPENNPLHLDMRVRDYLKFRARLKGMRGWQIRQRLPEVLEQCALTDVRRRIIGQLSKGYRQRVGLADALMSEPGLIILDEPTIGLDPNQIRSFRRLVKSLAGRHTVLISSHILHEVEMTCGRVLILHNGRLIASDVTENLTQFRVGGERVFIEIAAPRQKLEAALGLMPEIQQIEMRETDDQYWQCTITPRDGIDLREALSEMASSRGWRVRELTRSRHTLEDIFVHMTGNGEEEELS